MVRTTPCAASILNIVRSTIVSSPSPSRFQILKHLSLPPDTRSSGWVWSLSTTTHSRDGTDTLRFLVDHTISPEIQVKPSEDKKKKNHDYNLHWLFFKQIITWLKTEDFESVSMVTHSSVVSIYCHAECCRIQLHFLEFLPRRFLVRLRSIQTTNVFYSLEIKYWTFVF